MVRYSLHNFSEKNIIITFMISKKKNITTYVLNINAYVLRGTKLT